MWVYGGAYEPRASPLLSSKGRRSIYLSDLWELRVHLRAWVRLDAAAPTRPAARSGAALAPRLLPEQARCSSHLQPPGFL